MAGGDKMIEYHISLVGELGMFNVNMRVILGDLPGFVESQRQQAVNLEPDPWETEPVAEQLERRLGNGFEPFLMSVRNILNIVEEILNVSALHIGRSDLLVSW